MLRHVVCWSLTAEDTASKAEQSAEITAALQGLVAVVPEIRSLSVGTDSTSVDGNWDLILVADYDDEAGLKAYIDHPEHVRVAAMIRGLVSRRAAVDYLV